MARGAMQIIPAGARQVAPGVYQMRSPRRHGGGGKHKKHHGPKRHVSLLAQRQIKYAAVLQFADALQAQQRITVPAFINFRALILYIWGVNKKDKGAISTAKTMQYDKMAGSWGIGQMMQMAMGQALSGGMFGGGGGFGGGAPSVPQFRTQSAPDNGDGNSSQDVDNAVALIDALGNTGVV